MERAHQHGSCRSALRAFAWLFTAVGAGCVAGCLGGSGHAVQDAGGSGGAGGTGSCVLCAPDCFECGGGCQCSQIDASVNRPPWTSPFPNTGVAGTWKADAPRFCPHAGGVETLDVWSDARGVYALIAGPGAIDTGAASDAGPSAGGSSGSDAAPVAGTTGGSGAGAGGGGGFGGGGFGGNCAGNACVGEAILFNDGVDGWKRMHERQEGASFADRRLSGLAGGPLVLYGMTNSFMGGASCALGRVDGGDWACDRVGGSVRAFFAVSPTLAYAALDRELVVFDGTDWTAPGITAPASVAALWSDGTTLVTIDDNAVIAQLRDGAWTKPFGDLRAQSVWGSAGDDLWFIEGDFSGSATTRQLVHYDGLTTTVVAAIPPGTCGDFDFILRLWGAGDSVYVYGDRSLYRWDGAQLVELANWVCSFDQAARITRVWGNADDEVFVGLLDFLRPNVSDCGAAVVMYFDGALFHEI